MDSDDKTDELLDGWHEKSEKKTDEDSVDGRRNEAGS